jgi:hypothetical protein
MSLLSRTFRYNLDALTLERDTALQMQKDPMARIQTYAQFYHSVDRLFGDPHYTGDRQIDRQKKRFMFWRNLVDKCNAESNQGRRLAEASFSALFTSTIPKFKR